MPKTTVKTAEGFGGLESLPESVVARTIHVDCADTGSEALLYQGEPPADTTFTVGGAWHEAAANRWYRITRVIESSGEVAVWGEPES